MGNCQNPQLTHSSRIFHQNSAIKCVVSASQILIEDQNNQIAKLPIQTINDSMTSQKFARMKLTHTSNTIEAIPNSIAVTSNSHKRGRQLYFSQQNKVYYVEKFRNTTYSDSEFINTVYSCYLLYRFQNDPVGFNKEDLSIKISKIYLCNDIIQDYANQCSLIIESQILNQSNHKNKYVDLVNLGTRMREKEIAWQDKQFAEIIIQSCRKISRLHKFMLNGVTNIIIGNDGSLRVIGKFEAIDSPNPSQPYLKDIFCQALYGQIPKNQAHLASLQQQSKFKHPQCLKYIENINNLILEQKDNESQFITSPHLKFIQNYIDAYFYRMQMFSESTVQACILLGKYQQAQQLCTDYIRYHSLDKQYNKNSYKMYKILVTACQRIQKQEFPSKNSDIQAIQKFQDICYQLASQQIACWKVIDAIRYLEECRKSSLKLSENLKDKDTLGMQQELYLQLYYCLYAADQYGRGQAVLLEGINRNKNAKVLHVAYISLLCDCLKVQQAEKWLYKWTKAFDNIEMQLCSTKLLITKAAINGSKKIQYLNKAQQHIKVLAKSEYNTTTLIQNYLKSIYLQIQGDLYLMQKRYELANERYHTGLIYAKNNQNLQFYRIVNLMMAEANTLMLMKQYRKSKQLYERCLSGIGQECVTLRNTVIGNLGILKVRTGEKYQGIQQIQEILERTPGVQRQRNINYIFLDNFVSKNSLALNTFDLQE